MPVHDKVRWGVLGAAGIALKKVIPAMQKCERATVHAIASRSLEKARDAAGALAIPKAYGSYEELLSDPEVEAIYNPLPNHLHVPWSIRAAEGGKHVLCEKPLAMRVADADALIELCDRKGVRLFSVLQNRFNATNQLLKRAVEKGRFGHLLTVNVTMRWHRGLNYYLEDNGWRGSHDMAGGAFTNQAIHYVDTMQWLVGAAPASCSANTAPRCARNLPASPSIFQDSRCRTNRSWASWWISSNRAACRRVYCASN